MQTINTHKNSETILSYISTPNNLSAKAKIIEVINLDNNIVHVISDTTPFYVKGGGQQSDQGVLKIDDITFPILSVIFNEQGRVVHILEQIDKYSFVSGQIVEFIVNENIRLRNSAIHTAGELICAAIHVLGFEWKVVSAIHYSDNASVDFDVQLQDQERNDFEVQLQAVLRKMINQGNQVIINRYSSKEDVIFSCGYFPEYIHENEMIRVVNVWETVYGRPCCGTHLTNINMLKDIKISKIKNRKNVMQIRYETII